jgi:hypothetical protein
MYHGRFTLNKSGDIILSKTFFCHETLLGRCSMVTIQEVDKRELEGERALVTHEAHSKNGLRLFQIQSELPHQGNSLSVHLSYAEAMRFHGVDAMTAWLAARRAIESAFSASFPLPKVGVSYGNRAIGAMVTYRWGKQLNVGEAISLVVAFATWFETFLETPDAPPPSLAASKMFLSVSSSPSLVVPPTLPS